MMPKAILFDLGNVLFEIDIPKCSQNLYDLLDQKVDRSQFREDFRQKNEALETGQLSKAVFINFILKHVRKDVQALDVILAWNSMLIGMPHHHFDLLSRLRLKYNLYLLSNINAFHHPRFHEMIAEDHGIVDFDSYFNKVFYSHKIGHRKPNSEAFQYVIDNIQQAPMDVLYLDDTKGHLEGAAQLGFQTEHIPSIGDTAIVLEKLLRS
jgi:putative hydrolase of the HAD superfamily